MLFHFNDIDEYNSVLAAINDANEILCVVRLPVPPSCEIAFSSANILPTSPRCATGASAARIGVFEFRRAHYGAR